MSTSNLLKTVQRFMQILNDEYHQLEDNTSTNVEIEVSKGFRWFEIKKDSACIWFVQFS
ncbi:unnamed protein product [Chironomus riparius]|uniref:Uncharacterized protein n=1 Tax=Chironomus riparius TaxID=315576 RepID=A0A9N9RVX4_9DIPT|nr:unnamed protein product [Chironomus riparius]